MQYRYRTFSQRWAFHPWNFVSSSRERIEQAKADWKAGRFGKVPGDETEFIPLPERVVVQAGSRPSEPGRASEGSPTS